MIFNLRLGQVLHLLEKNGKIHLAAFDEIRAASNDDVQQNMRYIFCVCYLMVKPVTVVMIKMFLHIIIFSNLNITVIGK